MSCDPYRVKTKGRLPTKSSGVGDDKDLKGSVDDGSKEDWVGLIRSCWKRSRENGPQIKTRVPTRAGRFVMVVFTASFPHMSFSAALARQTNVSMDVDARLDC